MSSIARRYHFSSINSTNSWAKTNPHLMLPERITLVTAEEQLAGKGRFSRRWESPAGKNLYATFCFTLPETCPYIGNLAQVMALATADILRRHGFTAQLKWPNDLLIGSKKVGGVLCEVQDTPNGKRVVLGVGLNINMPKKQLEAIDQPATSLKMESGTPQDIEALTHELSEQFIDDLQTLTKEGFSPFLSRYRQQIIHHKGELLRFKSHNHLEEGYFYAINDDGSLCLKADTGELKTFFAGDLF